MSKYIDAERLNMEWQTLKPFGVTDTMIENLKWIVDRQPTIEVSEDCISREWLEQEIEKFAMSLYKDEEYWKGWNEALEAILAQIELAPSVVPQDHIGKSTEMVGEWIDTGSGQECSVCGEIQYGYDSMRKFCANCGAKMKG